MSKSSEIEWQQRCVSSSSYQDYIHNIQQQHTQNKCMSCHRQWLLLSPAIQLAMCVVQSHTCWQTKHHPKSSQMQPELHNAWAGPQPVEFASTFFIFFPLPCKRCNLALHRKVKYGCYINIQGLFFACSCHGVWTWPDLIFCGLCKHEWLKIESWKYTMRYTDCTVFNPPCGEFFCNEQFLSLLGTVWTSDGVTCLYLRLRIVCVYTAQKLEIPTSQN